jgi:hypothetical protein
MSQIPCTFSFTKTEHTEQMWFNCETCSSSPNLGVCYACAFTCHKGHTLSSYKVGGFYCDCGAGALDFACQNCTLSSFDKAMAGNFKIASLDTSLKLLKSAIESKYDSLISPVNINMALEISGSVFGCEDLVTQFIKGNYHQIENQSLLFGCGIFGSSNKIKNFRPNVDFEFSFFQENSKSEINNFVEEKSNKMIQNILDREPEGPVSIVSVLYFKGEWEKQFDPKDTHDSIFKGTKGKKVVDMMTACTDTRYMTSDTLFSIVLPYKEERFVTILTIPRSADGNIEPSERFFREWEKHLTLSDMEKTKFKLFVPKFKREYTYSNMDKILTNAGFNFTEFNQKTGIDEIIHKVVIEFDEVGTKASAATVGLSRGISSHPVFKADRPFMLAILDTSNNSLVFSGLIDLSF